MPGTPVLYYGDEIGMGDNFYLGDRNGVRTPMQWSPDRNAGFSKANPQQLYLPITIDPEYHYEAINVENQQKNLSSLLWWTRRVIAMRKNFKAFSRGSLEFLHPENSKVLAFLREHEDETILVVVNLSRFSQAVELDLSRFAGCSLDGGLQPELFSRRSKRRRTRSRSDRTQISGSSSGRNRMRRAPCRNASCPRSTSRPFCRRLLNDGQRAQFEREILPAFIRALPLVWREGAHDSRAADRRAVPIVEKAARNSGSSKLPISMATRDLCAPGADRDAARRRTPWRRRRRMR